MKPAKAKVTKPIRAIKIDVEKQEVYEVLLDPADPLADLQKHVGGYIELVGPPLPHGDILFVNEEGNFHLLAKPFYIMNTRYVMNGIIISGGRHAKSAKSLLSEIKALISFTF